MNFSLFKFASKSVFAFLFIITTSVINAQVEYPPERVTVVASLERGFAKSIEVSASELGIKTQVIKLLELKDSSFEMVNVLSFVSIIIISIYCS